MPVPGLQQMPVPGLQQMPAPAHPVALSVAPLAPGLKSKTTAVILAIIPLCGVFAAHDFYLGKTNKALIKLAIVFCTCFMGSAITGIWGIIDAILILTGAGVDGDGRPLI
jgi:TM2 domain-containing membrane protein YozV